MDDKIKQLIFNAYVASLADFDPDEIIGKSREEIQKEVDELPMVELKEILEGAGREVDHSFSEGGRWSNFETTVYHIFSKIDGEHQSVYLSVKEEKPATELQDGGDFETDFEIVYPHKIEKTVYKTYPQTKGASK